MASPQELVLLLLVTSPVLLDQAACLDTVTAGEPPDPTLITTSNLSQRPPCLASATDSSKRASLCNKFAEMTPSAPSLEMTEINTEVTVFEVTEIPDVVGWSWLDVPWSWYMVLQLVLGVAGVVGNLLVVLVLLQRRAFSQSTDTLITALAAADLFTSLLIIPVPKADVVPSSWLGEFYCRFVFNGFFMWLSVSASIFTLTTISVERFIAVLFPFVFNRLLKKQHVTSAVLVIWLAALVADIFIPLSISVDPSTHSCQYAFPSRLAQEVAGVTSFLLHFVIPAFLMLATQAVTARALYGQSRRFGSTSGRLVKAKNRVLKLLMMVIVIFIVCWGPNSVAYFLYNIGVIHYSFINRDLNRILTLLAFCNSCANPFIYTLQYPQFRLAMRDLFTCKGSPMMALFEVDLSNKTKYDEKNETKMTEVVSRA